MKTKQRLKPDVVLKNYWRDNRRFADLFNAVLFGGRQVIRAQELADLDTDESAVIQHRGHAESIQAARDSIKVCKLSAARGTELVLLGNEGQEHIHYAMPVRIMGYDYGSYKKQYEANAQKYRREGGPDRDEYLSRMGREDRFIPVITIVIYYGEKPWDGAVSLHGMLKIPAGLKKYVNDYRVTLIEARNHDLVFHNRDNADLFRLLGFFLDEGISKAEARKKAIQYSEEHGTDRSVIMTAAGIANSGIDGEAIKEGGTGMYAVFEEVMQEGIEKGIEKGKAEGIVETGLEFGLAENDILERLQKKLGISPAEAEQYLKDVTRKGFVK